ncbi:hypothetical protein GCM10025794_31860 [Massilia kyonggiensis]
MYVFDDDRHPLGNDGFSAVEGRDIKNVLVLANKHIVIIDN